jgi:hypothetical protein
MTQPPTEVRTLDLIGSITGRNVDGSLLLGGFSADVGSFGQQVAAWSSVP